MATAAKKVTTTVRRPIKPPPAPPVKTETKPESESETKVDSTGAAEMVESHEAPTVRLTKVNVSSEAAERVTVVVTNRFTLTRDDGTIETFLPGTQEMAVADATHWYAKASGVTVYNGSRV